MIRTSSRAYKEAVRISKTALKKGGRLTVAHGMSEEALRKHHSGAAKDISTELPCKEKLRELMSPYLDVDIMISDDSMYMVSGKRL